MAKIGAQYGIKLPEDALNMLGNEFAAGVDGVPPSGGDPTPIKITAITEPYGSGDWFGHRQDPGWAS